MENYLTPYQSVITEIKGIISSGQEAAYSASSKAMLLTYWNIGKRIVEQELGGTERAEYGRGLISALAEDLTKEFGKNYSKRNLHYYIKFYQCFPDEQIVNACVHNLNWTHIRSLLRVVDENARYWYTKYLTYLPTKEQLKTEIERQKEIFSMQHPKLQENGE